MECCHSFYHSTSAWGSAVGMRFTQVYSTRQSIFLVHTHDCIIHTQPGESTDGHSRFLSFFSISFLITTQILRIGTEKKRNVFGETIENAGDRKLTPPAQRKKKN